MSTMDEIDYKIFGDDMQFVEVELDPIEAAVAEPQIGGGGREEGSVLGGLGRVLDGDNS